jgi:hypothetical protein
MGRKYIPGHLKEFMESQIVRGSSGYEVVGRILDRISQKDLIQFLEFYEESLRDALNDVGVPASSDSESPVDLLAEQARRLQEQDEERESQADKFDDLLRSFKKEGE